MGDLGYENVGTEVAKIDSTSSMLPLIYAPLPLLALHGQNFAVLQLRRELAQSNDLKIESDCLSYILNHEKKVLYFDKHRIVKSPGYEIYMEQIDEAIFYKKEDGYYVWFKKKNTWLWGVSF